MTLTKLASFFLLLLGAFASSQAQTDKAAQKHNVEVFGGYSYLYVNIKSSGGAASIPSGSGFNGGLDVRVYRPISLVGEVSVFRTPATSCNCLGNPVGTTFVFGPRYSFPVPESSRLRPFAGVLIGGSTYSASSHYVYGNNISFAYDIRGGLDYRLTPRFAIRGTGAYVHSTLASNAESGFAPSGYPRAQFDIDLVYRF
jgi:hypothetical protein